MMVSLVTQTAGQIAIVTLEHIRCESENKDHAAYLKLLRKESFIIDLENAQQQQYTAAAEHFFFE